MAGLPPFCAFLLGLRRVSEPVFLDIEIYFLFDKQNTSTPSISLLVGGPSWGEYSNSARQSPDGTCLFCWEYALQPLDQAPFFSNKRISEAPRNEVPKMSA
jgi:hypothetical protein